MGQAPEREPVDAANYASEGPGAFHLVLVAWRHKSLIALGAVVGVVLGAIFYAQKPPVYQSSAQLIVTKKQASPLAGTSDDRASVYEDYLANHQVLLKSPLIVKKAVEKNQLQELPSLRGRSNPTAAVRASLNVLRDTKEATTNNVLTLTYSAGTSEDCETVLAAIISTYTTYLKDEYRNLSEDTLLQVLHATEKLRKDLDDKKAAFVEFKKKSPLVYWRGPEGMSPQEDWLVQVQAKRLGLMVQRTELRGRLDNIEKAVREGRGREALLAQLSSNPVSKTGQGNTEPRLHEQLLDLMIKEQMLLADYGPDHPDVKNLRTRIKQTRDFFGRNADEKEDKLGALDPVKLHMQALQQDLRDVELSLDALGKMSATEEKQVEEASKFKFADREFREDITRMEKQLDPYLARLSEIRVIQGVGGFRAEVIAPPIPGTRIGAGAVQIILLGMVIGLVGGFGLAYVADLTDRSFRSPDEIRRRLGVPVVGHVPLLIPSGEEADDTGVDLHVVAFHRPKSMQAEAFRAVRTALYFSTHGELHKVIQITSANAGDGKSTTAANLAVSIAQSGQRVLLIDADFRKPRQHRIFGFSSSEAGLVSVMAGEAVLKDVIRQTPVPGLSILPCGPRPSNPAELLTAMRFKELVDSVRGEYDFVLIDTPPLLAVSDPSVVAPRVDGIYLVLRITKNARVSADRCKEILNTLGANLLGVIVNRVGAAGSKGYGYEDGHAGYYYYYYHSAGYGYADGYYMDDANSRRPATNRTGANEPDPDEETKDPTVEEKSEREHRHRRDRARPTMWGRVFPWWNS